MKQEHIDLINDMESALNPVIEKHMKEKGLDIADVVYCSCYSAEEIALRIKREMRMALRKE